MLNAPVLDAGKDCYLVYASFKERHAIHPLGGRWDARLGCWVMPLSPHILVELAKKLPGLVLTERAQRHAAEADSLAALREQEDADVRYGDGIDPYQRVGIKFLVTARRAILADGIGVGKSVQAVRAAHEAGARRVVVVTRKSLIHNFQRQIELWTPQNAPPVDWHVTNYEQVVRKLDSYAGLRADVLVADECHYVKGRRTLRTKALRKLANSVPYVWLLTGRPVLNRPDELWSLLNIVRPKQYSSYWRFVEEYCEMEYNPWSGSKRPTGLRQDAKERLARDLASVVLRRTGDIIGLPPVTRETVSVKLLPAQQKIYDQMLKEFFVVLGGSSYVYAPSVLAQLTRLRQIACTPALIGGPDVSAKTLAVKELLEDYIDEHKILVFTCFAGYAKHLAGVLGKELGLTVPLICGDMSQKDRVESERRFNGDNACRVLVGTVGACGEGLNLQAASVVVLTDLPWTTAAIEQAEGRAIRRGQDKLVHVVTLVADKTVDEHVLEVLSGKEAVIGEVDAVIQVVEKLCRIS